MIICKSRSEFTKTRTQVDYSKSIGFVPTMGNLHEGHLSLVRESLKENDITIVSIFVNPKQFAPHEDLDNYPRTLGEDLLLLKDLERSDPTSEIYVFAPSKIEDIFESGYQTNISVEGLNKIAEGVDRPEHFNGVTTVVFRLFQMTKPKIAYFGKKDFQQQIIIKKMVKDLMLPIQIKSLPTVREESKLALSSRNNYLTQEQKKEGLNLISTLEHIELMIKNQFRAFNKILPDQIYEECSLLIKQNPAFTYLEVRDIHHFEHITENSLAIVILGAYRLGEIRILDNLEIQLGESLGT